MNRHKFVYLCISLTLVAFVFGGLPFAAAETSSVPAGITDTPTPPPTNTSAPPPTNTSAPTATNTSVPTATNTSVPANTLVPTPANTLVPAPTNTLVPAPANTLVPAPADTAVPTPANTAAPIVVGLPNTGGAAPQGGTSPWSLLLVAGSLVVLAFGLSMRAHRSMQR